jgi:hypothetical protein
MRVQEACRRPNPRSGGGVAAAANGAEATGEWEDVRDFRGVISSFSHEGGLRVRGGRLRLPNCVLPK